MLKFFISFVVTLALAFLSDAFDAFGASAASYVVYFASLIGAIVSFCMFVDLLPKPQESKEKS